MNVKGVFMHKTDEWSTPQNLFDVLNVKYNFTLDPCATEENHKCSNYYTLQDDGLSKEWSNETVFCNPPYSKISEWLEKCFTEWRRNNITIVLLLPARTDTKWFHEYLYKKPWVEITFLRGRLKFGNSKSSAPFPSMVAEFKKEVY